MLVFFYITGGHCGSSIRLLLLLLLPSTSQIVCSYHIKVKWGYFRCFTLAFLPITFGVSTQVSPTPRLKGADYLATSFAFGQMKKSNYHRHHHHSFGWFRIGLVKHGRLNVKLGLIISGSIRLVPNLRPGVGKN